MVTMIAALVALAGPASNPASGPVVPRRQAQATVRILPFAALRFAEIERGSPRSLRSTAIRSSDGATQPARLVEFE